MPQLLLATWSRSRAAPATRSSSVYGQQFEVTSKADQSPLTLADTALARDHRARTAGADAAMCRCCPKRPATFLIASAAVATLLARRSARRHQGIRVAQRRVHRQHRADRRARCRARCRARACDRHHLHRRARRRRVRGRSAREPPAPIHTYARLRRHRCASSAAVRIATPCSIATCRELEPYQLVAVGSSIKFCLVAEGSADFYPRFGPTSEWDTAAAQAVVEAAGGRVLQTDGQRLRYNTKAEVLNPHFLVFGDPTRDWLDELSLRG